MVDSDIYCRNRENRRGSALVTSLLVIVLLTVLVTALAEGMRVERKTARSYAGHERARLAVQVGGNAAQALLAKAIGEKQSYLVGITNDVEGYPVLVAGEKNLWDAGQMVPLISGESRWLEERTESGFFRYLNARRAWEVEGRKEDARPCADLNLRGKRVGPDERAGAYLAPWVEVQAEEGRSKLRYAFYLSDENARWNPKFHGEKEICELRNHAEDWFRGPGELPFPSAGAMAFSGEQVEKMRELARGAFGVRSVEEALVEGDASHRYFLSTDDTPFPEVIPAGLPDGGGAKYDLNDLATNPKHGATAALRAEKIAAIIGRNLPEFKNRDPSLAGGGGGAGERYLNRLAASVIDFIDEDSEPSETVAGEPAGRDFFPMVVAVAERFKRISLTGTKAVIESQVFVQAWNPYTKPIAPGKLAKIALKNRMRVVFGAGIVAPFSDYEQEVAMPEIRPNEFVVLEFPPVSQTWVSPTAAEAPKIAATSPAESADQSTHPYFEFYLDGKLVDMMRRAPVGPGEASAGLPRNPKTFSTSGNSWQCSFLPSQKGGGGWRTVGDPRGQFLSNYEWATVSSDEKYRNETRWKGRQGEVSPRWQNFAEQCAERDFVRANPPLGTTPGSIGVTPAQVASAYEVADAEDAPYWIKNRKLASIGELGGIFDPAQADDSGNAPSGGIPSSPFVSAGGRTLRIGQPEFSFSGGADWDTEEKRAIRLLDLFTARPLGGENPIYPMARGKININTADAEVLASLFQGIAVASDRSQSVLAEIAGAKARELAEKLVEGRPYEKSSDLYRFVNCLAEGDNFSPPLAETGETKGGQSGGLALMDRGREEIFGKMIEHVAVQSRAFRVHVIGQSLRGDGEVEASASAELVVQIFTRDDGVPLPKISYFRWED